MCREGSRITHSIIEIISPSIGPIPDRDRSTSKYEVLRPDHGEIDSGSDSLHGYDEFTTAEARNIRLTSSYIIERSTDRPSDRIDEEGRTLCHLIRARITDNLVEAIFSEGEPRDLESPCTTRRGCERRIGSCEIGYIPGR